MDSFFAHPDAYPTVAVSIVGVTLAIIFACHYWYKLRRSELEMGLKQAMVDRGMGADEICAVMEAGHAPKPEVERGYRLARGCKIKV